MSKLGPLHFKYGNALFLQLFTLRLFGAVFCQDSLAVNESLRVGWLQVARNLRESIDFSIDPCDDFFKFACGAWNKLNPIPDSLDRQDAFTLVRDIVKENLNKIYVGDQLKNHTSSSLRMSKMIFDACMKEENVVLNQSHPLMEMIADLGGWPLLQLSQWNEDDFKTERTVGSLWKRHSLPTLITPIVSADKWNSSIYVLYLDQAYLLFGFKSEEYYTKKTKSSTEVHQAYLQLIRQVIQLLLGDHGVNSTITKEMEDEIKEILNFEIRLAHLNTPAHKRREEMSLLKKIGFKDIVRMVPDFDWSTYVNALNVSQSFARNATVILVGEKYFNPMTALLKRTSKKTMANYLVWRLLFDQMIFLDSRFRNILYDFVHIMRGATEPRRSDFCIAYMTGEPNDGREFVGYAVGRVFVDNYFTYESKLVIEDMMKNIIRSFVETLENLTWMDNSTKYAAIEKAKGIIASIGYPTFIKDDDQLDKYYRHLLPLNSSSAGEVSNTRIEPEDSLFAIHNKIIRWMVNRLLSRLGKPFHREAFGGSPAIVNAWYSHIKNSIVFPAAILQPPFFHVSFPKAVNYGAMGSVIGHEIVHAFDDLGSQYDRNGNIVNWWSSVSKENFKEKKTCIIEQYGNFCYPNLSNNTCLNGRHTQGENIADNGGLKNAFFGYKRYTDANGVEPRLPSLEQYSMEQVFFLGFASFWCGHYKERHLINLLAVNEHSPGEFRVIGSLQNSQEFRQAFNCTAGKRMSPVETCVLW